jgi:hypothetical protein
MHNTNVFLSFQLESWWEEFAYLRTREPHIPFVNFAGPGPYIDSYWPPQDGTQLERGSLALWFTLKYWQILRQLVFLMIDSEPVWSENIRCLEHLLGEVRRSAMT